MIALDKLLEAVCNVINESYETIFPNFPNFPKFSFTRAMATIWKTKVHQKIEHNLLEAACNLLKAKRQEELQIGKKKTEYLKYKYNIFTNNRKNGKSLNDISVENVEEDSFCQLISR